MSIRANGDAALYTDSGVTLFDNADSRLFPNQFVNAHLLVDTHRNVVTVKSEAVQHGAPPLVAGCRGVLGRGDHVGEQHGAQGAA